MLFKDIGALHAYVDGTILSDIKYSIAHVNSYSNKAINSGSER